MAKTSSEVQEIYIGLLGRAADAEGLAYWTTGGGADLTVEDLRANIVNLQPEYISGMGAMTREEVVTELYSNLFNRAPEAEGLAYWTTGEGSSVNVDQLVIALNNGASTDDLAVVANKVTAAEYYTENAAVYSDATAAAAVADVDSSALSLTASQTATDAITAPPTAVEAFTLTAATDTSDFSAATGPVEVIVDGDDDATDGDEFSIVGSSFDDTFIVDTYLRADINAGDGIDTLDLSSVGITMAAGDGAVNLNTGIADDALNGTFRNFENVIANENGGRIVGTSGANVVTLQDTGGTDDIETAGGDDLIIALDGAFVSGTDTIDGGSGTDTFRIDDVTAVTLSTAADVSNIENIEVTGTGNDDVTITATNQFTSTSTSGISGGIRNIRVVDPGDADTNNKVVNTEANADSSLVKVTFTNIQELDLDQGNAANTVRIDSNTLTGVEKIDVANGTITTVGGDYDLSEIEFSTVTTINGSATKDDRLFFGNEDDLGSITTVALGASTGDVISFKGTDVGDIRAMIGNIGGVEGLEFGSASSVAIDDGDAASFQTITGTEFDSDQLTLDGAGAGVAGVLTNVAITGVEQIAIDAAGNNSSITIGKSSLEDGIVVVGDSGTDTVTLGASSVSLENVTFQDFETLDIAAKTASISVETFAGFKNVNSTASGRLTFTDSGSITLKGTQAGAGRFDMADEADAVTLNGFSDGTNAVDVRLGGGDDSLSFSGSNTLANATIKMEEGDDTVNLGSDSQEITGVVDGGLGTDTITFSDTTVAAGELLAVDFDSFEVVRYAGPSQTALDIDIGASEVSAGTWDFSADTDATNANDLNFSLFTKQGVTVIGSAGADTITTTAKSMTVDAGAGSDTIVVTGNATAAVVESYELTLGSGTDTVQLGAAIKSAVAGTNDTDSITINDWSGDKFNVSTGAVDIDSTDFIAQAVAQAYVDNDASTTLTEALTAAELATGTGKGAAAAATVDKATVFQFDGDTYVAFFDDVDGYNAANDLYVKLVGEHDLTSSNFTF